MTTDQLTTSTASGLRNHLQLLERERASAALTPLADDASYMADLMDEIGAVRSAYVGAAVTEIASLRAALDAPLIG
ncbi:MAG: hypothetical protein HZB46_09135 [Solirubrobacterales bacterium]|nr:hypothetical protein [Solirubrobacterales bacterium]